MVASEWSCWRIMRHADFSVGQSFSVASTQIDLIETISVPASLAFSRHTGEM